MHKNSADVSYIKPSIYIMECCKEHNYSLVAELVVLQDLGLEASLEATLSMPQGSIKAVGGSFGRVIDGQTQEEVQDVLNSWGLGKMQFSWMCMWDENA